MTITDFSTAVNQVRALIPDIEQLPNAADPTAPDEFMFSDAHLTAFLVLNANDVRLAAADACEVLGTSEAIILKVITTEDLVTDGSKLMAQYLARAKQLRDTAAGVGTDQVDGFDIVPYHLPWSRRFWPEGATVPWL